VAGYSGTPLAAKLGVKEGSRVALLYAPKSFSLDLPAGVTVRRRAQGGVDVVVAFFVQRAKLEERLPSLGPMIFPSGGLWIAWPKRSSRVPSDLTDDTIRLLALPRGLVDNKVCAVDETWTALRFVWRLEHRGSPPSSAT
jgi:hypothetical protein